MFLTSADLHLTYLICRTKFRQIWVCSYSVRLFFTDSFYCLYVYLSWLFILLSVSPSVCQSICLSVHLSVSPSVCQSFCLSVLLSVSHSVCQSFCLSVILSFSPSVCQSFCLSFLLSVYSSIYLSAYLMCPRNMFVSFII